MLIKKLLLGKGNFIKALLLTAIILSNNFIAHSNNSILHFSISNKKFRNNWENSKCCCSHFVRRAVSQSSDPKMKSVEFEYQTGASSALIFQVPYLYQDDNILQIAKNKILASNCNVLVHHPNETALCLKVPWKFSINHSAPKGMMVYIINAKVKNTKVNLDPINQQLNV